MKICDITIPLDDSLAGWPGDAPFHFSWTWRKNDGATVNVGRCELSLHSGSHADAPFHYDDAGPPIAAMDLHPSTAPACVIHLTGRPRLRREDLEPFDL